MSVNIHGKEYVTVAERFTEAKKFIKSISTEVLYQDPVVIRATVVTDKGTFTGISAANPAKMIEKASPYEVAETSAVGRALGFAGYGAVESIATADEMLKATKETEPVKSVIKKATPFQLKKIFTLLPLKGKTKEGIYKAYNVKSLTELEINQASAVIDKLEKMTDLKVMVKEVLDENINPSDLPF